MLKNDDKTTISDLILEIVVDTYFTELSETDLKRFMPIFTGDPKIKRVFLQRIEVKENSISNQ